MIDHMPSYAVIKQVADGVDTETGRIDRILGRVDRSLNSNAFRAGITIATIVSFVVAVGLVCFAANMLLR